MQTFDVIIIGGGIVGVTTACALADRGVRVAVVEARSLHAGAEYTGRDPRAFALTRASERIFTALGIWDDICSKGVGPFREMVVWDAAGPGLIHFDCAELGEPYLGNITEPRVIHAALLDRLQALESAEVFSPARFEEIVITATQAGVTLADGQELAAGLVVAADGVNSPVRKHVGIKASVHDYHQDSLVALVKTEQPHRETAWQRFLPGGPLAFLPLHSGWCSIVWTLPRAEAEQILALDKPAFHETLGKAFDFRLGGIVDSGDRETCPLRRLHAEQYVRERVALVGDAAHAIHPLAGQGVNLGLLDAAALAEVVTDAMASGRAAGEMPDLRRYARWRRGDNLLMMSAMDGFNLLFGSELAPVSWLRNRGLSLVNAATPVKGLIMRQAMGLQGDLPALAKR